MGRASGSDTHAYQIKNSFVQLTAEEETDFSRSQRTCSDMGPQRPAESPEYKANFIPSTPSPFYSAQPDPIQFEAMPYMDESQLGGMPALAFGDFAPDVSCVQGYNLQEVAPVAFGPQIQYDPSTGNYMYDYNNFVPYDGNMGYTMVGMDQMEDISTSGQHTQVLLAALSEKIGEDQVSGEVRLEPNNVVAGNSEDLTATGEMEAWEGTTGVECWEGDRNGAWEGQGWGHSGNYAAAEDQSFGNNGSQQTQPSNRRAERREAREAKAGRRQFGPSAISMDTSAAQEDAPAKGSNGWGVTTIMFRNIPNKYTREMLVNQLEQDMKGLFDFIYLPIDFKNKCNVGYAFINFRTVEACDTFVNRFNGVEVRKCLPGLNSRKVTEVTPARVQGFEENVQRLRNSPVMRELVHKPEWMPLIFDYNGENMPFPGPERPLEPIKPRRRARDDDS